MDQYTPMILLHLSSSVLDYQHSYLPRYSMKMTDVSWTPHFVLTSTLYSWKHLWSPQHYILKYHSQSLIKRKQYFGSFLKCVSVITFSVKVLKYVAYSILSQLKGVSILFYPILMQSPVVGYERAYRVAGRVEMLDKLQQ